MLIIYFECYFADVSMVLFSEVRRKPEAVKSLPSVLFSHL